MACIGEQKWAGYYLGNGNYIVRHAPKQSEKISYKITSAIPGFPEQSGQFIVDNLWPGILTRANVSAVVNGRAGISPEMAVKLSAAFGNSPTFWTTLQTNYELWHAQRKVKRSTIRH